MGNHGVRGVPMGERISGNGAFKGKLSHNWVHSRDDLLSALFQGVLPFQRIFGGNLEDVT